MLFLLLTIASIVAQHQVISPEAGTTMDAVVNDFTFRDRKMQLVDTAGVFRGYKGLVGQGALPDDERAGLWSALDNDGALLSSDSYVDNDGGGNGNGTELLDPGMGTRK